MGTGLSCPKDMRLIRRFRVLVREPVLQFLLIGTSLFMLYAVLNPSGSSSNLDIEISGNQVAGIVDQFSRTWRRAPTKEELQSLIDDQVRTEVYVREAMKLGLDRNDTIVRRRLRQKMEFLSESQFSIKDPTDAELLEFFDGHANRYLTDSIITFQQVFFNEERRGKNLSSDADVLRLQLNSQTGEPDLSGLGDPIDLASHWTGSSSSDLVALFGSSFTDVLLKQPLERWIGPINSAFGAHLVRIDSLVEGSIPAMETIRDQLTRDWLLAQRVEFEESTYQRLLRPYSVIKPQLITP